MEIHMNIHRVRKVEDQENIAPYQKKTLKCEPKKVGLGGALGDLNINQPAKLNQKKIETIASKNKSTKICHGNSYKYVQSRVDSGLCNKSQSQVSKITSKCEQIPTAIPTKNVLKEIQNKKVDFTKPCQESKKPVQKVGSLKSSLTQSTEKLSRLRLVEVPVSPNISRLPEDVEDIDDNDVDKLELMSQYVKDIYTYLAELELKYPIEEDFLRNHTVINQRMRTTLVDWLVEVHCQFGLVLDTFHLTVGILDRYLQAVTTVSRNELQLVGVTCMFIASKYEEVYPPDISDFVYVTANAYSRGDVLRCERQVMRTLGFSFARPVPLTFLRRFIKVARGTSKRHHLAKYLVELSLVEYATAHRRPSELAAAAICLSLHLVGGAVLSHVWTPALAHYSGYTLPNIEPLVHQMARVALAAAESLAERVKLKARVKRDGVDAAAARQALAALEARPHAVADKYKAENVAAVALLPQLQGAAIRRLADASRA